MSGKTRCRWLASIPVLFGMLFGGCTGVSDAKRGGATEPAARPESTSVTQRVGWRPFTAEAFSGSIREGWDVVVVDPRTFFGDIRDKNGFSSLPDKAREELLASIPQLDGKVMLRMFFDHDEILPTNGIIVGCYRTPYPTELAISENKRAGIDTTKFSNIVYAGKQYELLKSSLARFDSYSAEIREGSCYLEIGISTRPGDVQPLDDFRAFVADLKIDTSQLPTPR